MGEKYIFSLEGVIYQQYFTLGGTQCQSIYLLKVAVISWLLWIYNVFKAGLNYCFCFHTVGCKGYSYIKSYLKRDVLINLFHYRSDQDDI